MRMRTKGLARHKLNSIAPLVKHIIDMQTLAIALQPISQVLIAVRIVIIRQPLAPIAIIVVINELT